MYFFGSLFITQLKHNNHCFLLLLYFQMSPKYTEIVRSLSDLNYVRYSAYRTAMKLRQLQKKFGLDHVTLENLIESFDQHGLGPNATSKIDKEEKCNMNGDAVNGEKNGDNNIRDDVNDDIPYELRLIGVPEMVSCLKTIFESVSTQKQDDGKKDLKSKSGAPTSSYNKLNVPLHVDLCLNWLLDLYDAYVYLSIS